MESTDVLLFPHSTTVATLMPLADAARDELCLRRSNRLLAQAARVIPGGLNSGRRSASSCICVKEAHGAYLWDVDGNRYVDYHAAYGPIVLGHAHPTVCDRARDAAAAGTLFGLGATSSEVRLAKSITRLVPSVDQVLLCNSGSEATYHAIRVARAFTDAPLLLRFHGPFHGFHDEVLCTSGTLAATHNHTVWCRFNDLESVREAIGQNVGRIAAVILEPAVHNAPGGSILPQPGFLEGLRDLCDQQGIVLIFDEVITGFRHALGGYQSISGVQPDLTAMGKAIANGFPLAALGGKREIMERFNTHPHGDVWYGGTYNGNAVSVGAALATLAVMEREPVFEHIFALGERMRAGLRSIVAEVGVDACVGGFGSLFVLSFFPEPARDHEDVERNDTELFLAYRRELVRRGVLEIPENVGRSHISFSHSEADIDLSLEVARDAVVAALDLRAAGQLAGKRETTAEGSKATSKAPIRPCRAGR
jgi:glutamate-1-semialdehyde 2,1-aminomutase